MYTMTTTSERIAEVISRLNALTGRSYQVIDRCAPYSTYDVYSTDSAGRRTTKLFSASSYYAAKRYLERLLDEEERWA
jgi:hypothetical protein